MKMEWLKIYRSNYLFIIPFCLLVITILPWFTSINEMKSHQESLPFMLALTYLKIWVM